MAGLSFSSVATIPGSRRIRKLAHGQAFRPIDLSCIERTVQAFAAAESQALREE